MRAASARAQACASGRAVSSTDMHDSALQLVAPSALLRMYTFHTPQPPVTPEFKQA